MTIGFSTPLPAYTVDPAFVAKKAEELGFDSLWYAEHPAVPVHSDTVTNGTPPSTNRRANKQRCPKESRP